MLKLHSDARLATELAAELRRQEEPGHEFGRS